MNLIKPKKNKTLLQIGIPCGFNSEKYAEFLIETCDKTISDEVEIQYLLSVNNSDVNVDFLRNIKTDKSKKVFIYNKTNSSGLGHGKNLDFLLTKINSELGAILDADIAFLKKGWDKYLLPQIKNKNVIIGAEYDGEKYKNFPNAIGCFFKTKILKKCNISFTPKQTFMSRLLNTYKTKKIKVNSNEMSKIYSVNKGSSIYLDTGYQLPFKLKKNGYSGIAMPIYRKHNKEAKFIGNVGEEYHFKNQPIFTHIGRSSYRLFDKNEDVIKWKEATINWINKQ